MNQLNDAQTAKKTKEEEEMIVVAMKEKVASVQAEAYAQALDYTIVRGVINVLTNTSIMDETPKTSNAAIADEVVPQDKELAS